MPPKQARQIGGAVRKRPAGHVSGESDNDGPVASDSRDGSAKTFKVPSALQHVGESGTWERPQIQAMVDWQRSLKKAGFDEASELIRNTRGKDARKVLAISLSLCKNDAEMTMIESRTRSSTDQKKTTSGWMSMFRIWKLRGLPICDETKSVRQHCLATLESRTDDTFDGGVAYYYVHKHEDERLSTHSRSVRMEGAARIDDELEWTDIGAAMTTDFGEEPAVHQKRSSKKKLSDAVKQPKASKLDKRIQHIEDTYAEEDDMKSQLINSAKHDHWLFNANKLHKDILFEIDHFLGKVKKDMITYARNLSISLVGQMNNSFKALRDQEATLGKVIHSVTPESFTDDHNKAFDDAKTCFVDFVKIKKRVSDDCK